MEVRTSLDFKGAVRQALKLAAVSRVIRDYIVLKILRLDSISHKVK
jgi:hypothetical protein